MFGQKNLKIISDSESFDVFIQDCSSQESIAVDLESNSLHAYRERICLIQVSTLHSDYIIDPLVLDDIRPFLDILENRSIRKVMHGSDFDIVSLKRDYDVQITNLFDTLIAARFLNYEGLSLASLIQQHFGFHLDKRYQKHDWSKRPLMQEHQDYARGDTHWLLALHEYLCLRLRSCNMLNATLEESQRLTFKEWNGKGAHSQPFLKIRHAKSLSLKEQRILRAIWELRESVAQSYDTPSFKVISNQKIFLLASQEHTKEEITGIIQNSRLQNSLPAVLQCIEEGPNDERIIKPKPKARVSKPPRGPQAERLSQKLKDWRNRKVEKNGLLPVLVFSNEQLKDIARYAPSMRSELAAIPSVRKWQVRLYCDEILSLVQEVFPK